MQEDDNLSGEYIDIDNKDEVLESIVDGNIKLGANDEEGYMDIIEQ